MTSRYQDVKIINSKKRLVILSLAAAAALGGTAMAAGASPELPLRGSGTFCLAPDAARTLTTQNMSLEAIAPATAADNCVTLPGTGTLSADLLGGDIPLEGGMRFTGAGHQLDVSNVHIHVGKRSTSADIVQTASAAKNVDFLHYTLSPSTVSVTPRTVNAASIPLNLTTPGAVAFTDALGSSPVKAGEPLFTFDGRAEFTTPFNDVTMP
ncbi:HtaA domain-containing protein [Streptomyces sp. ISL-96]|uniref:HtaA domain-containing protein n=1 Tax=Streptomyces sp. ISL-96 TaxID=2819191 RepID=UPI001BE9D957|nr:HtaA domain-containing protein [Streptomyces sp. ISL-96]MBT2493929.1 HtaA domain-containing protein [Streptomyces sp. ISL-96]